MEPPPPPPYSEAINYPQSSGPGLPVSQEPAGQQESEPANDTENLPPPPSYVESNEQYSHYASTALHPLLSQSNDNDTNANRTDNEVNTSVNYEDPPPSYQTIPAQVISGYLSGVPLAPPAQYNYATWQGTPNAQDPKYFGGGNIPYGYQPNPAQYNTSQAVNNYNSCGYQSMPYTGSSVAPQTNSLQAPGGHVQGFATTPLAYGDQVNEDRSKSNKGKIACAVLLFIVIVIIVVFLPI